MDAQAGPANSTVTTSALRLLAWAHRMSLLKADSYFPGTDYEDPTLDPLGETSVAILRQKLIRFIGVNESRNEITVFLHRAAPGDRQARALPKTCDGFTLKYKQGATNPVAPANISEAATPCAVLQSGGALRYTCGSSISVGNAASAGTLGSLLRDQTGQLFGLSNNHVSGSCNYAPVGLPIVAPGIVDVTPTNPRPFTIGTHFRQLSMQMGDPTVVDTLTNHDAAVFAIANDGFVSSMQQTHFDTPAAVASLAAGLTVEKVGRSSGLTRGFVTARLVGPVPISYSASQYGFSGLVYFEPMYVVVGQTDRFSEAGDSGSLVVSIDPATGARAAVGIVVGGGDDSSAPGGKFSLILPIAPILAGLGMSLVSNHNI